MEDVVFGFPIYALGIVAGGDEGEDVLLVAGGGGPSKSGVRNALLAYALQPGGRVRRVAELSCGPEAPMCLSVDGHACPRAEGAAVRPGPVVARRTRVALGVNDRLWRVALEHGGMRLALEDSAQADFAEADSHVRALSVGGPLLATLGADGNARLWSWPQLEEVGSLAGGSDVSLWWDGASGLVAVARAGGVSVHTCTAGGADPRAEVLVRGVPRFVRLLSGPRGPMMMVVAGGASGPYGRVTLHDAKGGAEVCGRWLPRHFRPTAACVSPDLETAVVGGADGSLVVLSVPRLRIVARVAPIHGFVVTSLVAVGGDADGDVVVYSGSGDGTVRATVVRALRSGGSVSVFMRALCVALLAVFLYYLLGE